MASALCGKDPQGVESDAILYLHFHTTPYRQPYLASQGVNGQGSGPAGRIKHSEPLPQLDATGFMVLTADVRDP